MSRLNPTRDDRLVLAMAGGADVKGAAAEAGMSERTAHRRIRDPEFAKRVAAARDAIWQQAVGQLAGSATEAAETLRELLHSSSEMAKLRAAIAILEEGSRLREVVEIEARLTALEEQRNA